MSDGEVVDDSYKMREELQSLRNSCGLYRMRRRKGTKAVGLKEISFVILRLWDMWTVRESITHF